MDEEEKRNEEEVRMGLTLKNITHLATVSSAAIISSYSPTSTFAKPLEKAEISI